MIINVFTGVLTVVVILLALLFYRGLRKRTEIAGKLGISEKETKKNHLIRGISGISLVILLSLSFLAPAIQNSKEITFYTSHVSFVFDESKSMEAANRLARAKVIAVEFTKAFPDLNVAVYGFTREIRSHFYWDTDYNDFWRTVEQVVSIEGVPTNGTDIGKAIGRMVNYFPEEAESKIIVLLSDGENKGNEEDLEAALNSARQNNVKIIAVGVGERQGAYIDGVVTYLNEPLLRRAAERTGGIYVGEAELEKAFQFLDENLIEKKREILTQDTVLRKVFLVLSLIPLFFLIIKN